MLALFHTCENKSICILLQYLTEFRFVLKSGKPSQEREKSSSGEHHQFRDLLVRFQQLFCISTIFSLQPRYSKGVSLCDYLSWPHSNLFVSFSVPYLLVSFHCFVRFARICFVYSFVPSIFFCSSKLFLRY